MADSFAIKDNERTRRRLYKVIRERVEGCFEPRCWLLRDKNDIGQLYIDRKTSMDGKGRFVQIRRLLYYIAYGEVPDMHRIDMRCANPKRCVNPAHARVKGTQQDVSKCLERGWITLDQVNEYYLHA
jgi:hypothetical protein